MDYTLNATGVLLQLSVDPLGWCSVSASKNGLVHELGADTYTLVRRRLLDGITCLLTPSTGTIEGINVKCILMLFEKHFSIYAGMENEKRHLFFQAPNGELGIHTVLDASEQATWVQVLSDIEILVGNGTDFVPSFELRYIRQHGSLMAKNVKFLMNGKIVKTPW